jgi:hypothetical protein
MRRTLAKTGFNDPLVGATLSAYVPFMSTSLARFIKWSRALEKSSCGHTCK